jgi:hypothetical protein
MYPRVSGGNEPPRLADERAQARCLARPSTAAYAVLPGVAVAVRSTAAGAVKAADAEAANRRRPAGQARAFGAGVTARCRLEPGGQGGGCGWCGHVRFLETAAPPYAQIRHTDIEHIKNKRKGRSDRRSIEERKPPHEGSSLGPRAQRPPKPWRRRVQAEAETRCQRCTNAEKPISSYSSVPFEAHPNDKSSNI